VEALVFAESTATSEIRPQWEGLRNSKIHSEADFDQATQLIELELHRILELMGPEMSAERLHVLESVLERRARSRALEVAQARAGGWGLHSIMP